MRYFRASNIFGEKVYFKSFKDVAVWSAQIERLTVREEEGSSPKPDLSEQCATFAQQFENDVFILKMHHVFRSHRSGREIA